jgi:hypothetical protein
MTTLVYPQLATGALSQFPVRKKRRARTVINRSADGSTVKLADPACEVTEWNLTYADLSDQEAATLQSFFAAAEGSLNGFVFQISVNSASHSARGTARSCTGL